MSGIDDIAAERQRQIDVEGWTPEHDDSHIDQSLAMAAALYAAPEPLYVCETGSLSVSAVDPWPWKDMVDVSGGRGDTPVWGYVNAWDKRQEFERRRALVVAGALIAAEIDRLDRAAKEE